MNKEDIRVFKLSTGEDIVAIVLEETPNSIYVKTPLKIIKIPHPSDNRITVYFTVWGELKLENEPIYINPSHIVSYYWLNDVDKHKIKKYMESDLSDTDMIDSSISIN